MDQVHVVALIAAMLQVRNAVEDLQAELGSRDRPEHESSVEEAQTLIARVIDAQPKLPDAPNTRG